MSPSCQRDLLICLCAALVGLAGCKHAESTDTASAEPGRADPASADPAGAAAAAPAPIAAPVAGAAADKKAAAAAEALPDAIDTADLDDTERGLLVRVLKAQFGPCGKPRSLLDALKAGDCPLATRLARGVVHNIEKGLGERQIVKRYLTEVERLNTVVEVDVRGAPREGPADAPVVVAVFSDFECPFCRRVAAPLKQIVAHYPAAALVFKNFPLSRAHPHAEGAARAGWAAHQQGRFWPLHDKMFEQAPALSYDKVEAYAEALGLDMARFAKDVQSDAARAAVKADYDEGTKIGVDGTPTFFINGRRADSLSQVQDAIREAMTEKGVAAMPEALEIDDDAFEVRKP
jgi:protein-disulfide isomerase